jgi:hypothetical protein
MAQSTSGGASPFLLQTIQRPRKARRISCQQRFTKSVQIEAGNIEHGVLTSSSVSWPLG